MLGGPVTITHASGPLAGSVQTFAPPKDRIVFGRDPDKCDVVFPPEETRVGRQHFALLREPTGDWAIDLFGERFVSIDGVPAETGQAVPSGATLRLGSSDGPGVTVAFAAAIGDSPFKPTQEQEKPPPVRRTVRRLAYGGVAIALLLAAGIGTWIANDIAEQRRVAQVFASLSDAQSKLTEEQARLSSERISAAHTDRLRRAVHLVVLEDPQGRQTGTGTAWAVGPDVLATNAHVAEIRDELKPGEKYLVRAPGPGGKLYTVVSHEIHPGYKSFPAYITAKDTGFISSFRSGRPSRLSAGLGYDVALLRIEGTLPADAILEIASPAELAALGPGMPLASAGFPLENISGDEVSPLGAIPQMRFGNITALTDFFFLPGTPDEALLIHHSVPSAGGASGSPIIGQSGKVVALHNAGNYIFDPDKRLPRIPSAALINYSQRADLALDLLGGTAAARLEREKVHWDKQLANFKRGIDVFGAWILDKAKPSARAVAQLVFEQRDRLEAGDVQNSDGKTQRVRVQQLKLAGRKPHVVFVYADEETDIKIYLVEGDKKVAENTNSFWYPNVRFTPPADGAWSLYIVGPDKDASVTTRVYTWQSPST